MMEDKSNYSTSQLKLCSYRYLQKLAKSMKLPSNVKKVYLVEMINAKKCSPESEVQRIIRRVKLERKHLTQVKKRSKQAVESSSSGSVSPAISDTPKRPPCMLRCSELRHQMMRSQNSINSTSHPASDRVLRSCNVKLKPFMNKFVEVNQRHGDMVDQATQMNVRVIKKYKPNILSNKERQIVPVTQMGSSQILVKRQRLLSGIFPIGKELVPVRGVGVRNSEGKMAALTAFIHKPQGADTNYTRTRSNNSLKRNIELTLQDIINGNVEQATSLNYPNTSGVQDVANITEVTPETTSSVYYHKKIRAEQVRERRSTLNTRCELPRINEAFGQFRSNHIRHDVTQPLYVQVSEESERILNYPQYAKRNTSLLETVYNFKSHFLTNQPLLQLATTTNTTCVYSTPTVATAAPQRPATTYTEPQMASNMNVAYERDQYHGNIDNSQMNDCLRFAEQDYDFRCYEDPNKSSSSIGTIQSQDLGANVTISDMVEDALELISQDGDYMERMGMDVRMQCVLCNWAGPKIILEYHIRKEHSNDIDKQEKREWNITYSLGSVHQQLWKSRVIEHESALYVLSVKYEPPGCFLATLAAARMEYDAIQRTRRDMECHQYSMYQIEQNKIKQQQEKERLKQETLYFRGLWDKAIKDEEEAERRRAEARHKTGHDRALAIEERKQNLEKQAQEHQVIEDAWASLGEQGLAQIKAEEELRRRKERELDECNRKMIELRDNMRASESANDDFIREEAARYQKVVDEKRCQYLSWSQKTNRDVRKAMIDQIHDRKQAREELQKKLQEQDEYHRQLFNQLSQLAAHKDLTDAQQRKKHQENLLKQIEYNKLLKERAIQEEQEQRKKCQRATEEYNEEISRMLCRPFYSDMQHPFLRQMAGGLKMREKCPCSKPDYCAVPEKKPN
ncbi:uncharacterized protein LOC133516451 isoform X2 [Cydia pomonella]|uniref:uncharacterized protein LOC133516451 isoform X2 n=1 Tax=Cydia pomonella TaxID=82600 RepID=UPI002ADD35EA|nr:uncharacterized protein LOC133516451 isoform X2 [Cydia pomonella]